MAAAQPTYELDEEIIRLLRQKEKLIRDLQSPGLSTRRQASNPSAAAGGCTGPLSHLASSGGRPEKHCRPLHHPH